MYIPAYGQRRPLCPRHPFLGRERQVRVVSSQADVSHQGAIFWVALNYRTIGQEAAAWPNASWPVKTLKKFLLPRTCPCRWRQMRA